VKRVRFVIFLAALLIVVRPSFVFADISATLKKADSLYRADKHAEAEDILLKALSDVTTNKEKAEVYWRLARTVEKIGERKKNDGTASKEELLAIFEKGEKYADRAIRYNPQDYNAYFWKSANIGRWGQTKGILNSLFKAGPMRDLLVKAISIKPDFPDAYYVLGQLYEQVPGFPLSFGNVEYAVSLGRKAVDLMKKWYAAGLKKEIDYSYYKELAKHLYKRDWSARKRKKYQPKERRKYNSETDLLKKSFYYEGIVSLKDISDREEAVEMIRWVIEKLESIPNKTPSKLDDLKESKELLAKWE